MHARNAQFVLPTTGGNRPLTERCGSTLPAPSETEREENKYIDGAHRLWMR